MKLVIAVCGLLAFFLIAGLYVECRRGVMKEADAIAAIRILAAFHATEVDVNKQEHVEALTGLQNKYPYNSFLKDYVATYRASLHEEN